MFVISIFKPASQREVSLIGVMSLLLCVLRRGKSANDLWELMVTNGVPLKTPIQYIYKETFLSVS